MAKTNAGQDEAPESQPEPQAAKVRQAILSIKGTSEWSQWLGELATKFRTTKAGVIDRALTEFAARNEFREPPER